MNTNRIQFAFVLLVLLAARISLAEDHDFPTESSEPPVVATIKPAPVVVVVRPAPPFNATAAAKSLAGKSGRDLDEALDQLNSVQARQVERVVEKQINGLNGAIGTTSMGVGVVSGLNGQVAGFMQAGIGIWQQQVSAAESLRSRVSARATQAAIEEQR